MKPAEFVSRVVYLFEFDMGIEAKLRPKGFSACALAITMSSVYNTVVIHEQGYKFILRAKTILGHSVIQATMIDDDLFEITGSVCFSISASNDILETWQVCDKDIEQLVSMLAFLTLRTNHTIRTKT